MKDQEPRQLNLGLDLALPPTARTALLREAGFTPETQDPDAHLNNQPPIGGAIFDAIDARTLTSIGNQIADVLEGF